eukprot:15473658-Alexandrium_andersonii.AAC.3
MPMLKHSCLYFNRVCFWVHKEPHPSVFIRDVCPAQVFVQGLVAKMGRSVVDSWGVLPDAVVLRSNGRARRAGQG